MTQSAEEKKRNKSVNFSKRKKRDNILHEYVSSLPEKDFDYSGFSEYVKGLITQDMLQRAEKLGIEIEGMKDMGAVSAPKLPPVTVGTRAEVKHDEDEDPMNELLEELEPEKEEPKKTTSRHQEEDDDDDDNLDFREELKLF